MQSADLNDYAQWREKAGKPMTEQIEEHLIEEYDSAIEYRSYLYRQYRQMYDKNTIDISYLRRMKRNDEIEFLSDARKLMRQIKEEQEVYKKFYEQYIRFKEHLKYIDSIELKPYTKEKILDDFNAWQEKYDVKSTDIVEEYIALKKYIIVMKNQYDVLHSKVASEHNIYFKATKGTPEHIQSWRRINVMKKVELFHRKRLEIIADYAKELREREPGLNDLKAYTEQQIKHFLEHEIACMI